MGEIRVNIELVNSFDKVMAEKGLIPKQNIRILKANALVDTGAITLAIPCDLAVELGLEEIKETMRGIFADGRSEELPVVGGFILRLPDFDNMSMITDAVVCPPGSQEILFGQIPLERFDLLADCNERKLLRKHPEAGMPVLRV